MPDETGRMRAWEVADADADETPAAPEPTAEPATAGGADDLRKKVQNPVGAMYSLPFEGSFDFGAENGSAFILNVQPVIPVTWGDVNFISRAILPIVYSPGLITGLPEIPASEDGDGTWGLGDLNYTGFFSPAAPGAVIWGLGPSITLPTATSDQTGTGKWSAGASVVVLTQPKPWSLGVLLRQLWSFAGDDDRPDVNQFLLQPFINYNLDGGWYLTSTPVLTANWDQEDNGWTVPLGGGVGRVFNAGKQPMNVRLQAFYNVVRPDFAPDWSLMFTIQLMFPK
jgi:hypothetical protein